jgi:4-azaleucine resistance transporter AzlC
MPEPDSTDRPPGREFLAGALQVSPLLAGVAPFALILGALAAGAGLSPAEATLMSALVFAGSAQVAAVDLWSTAPPAAVIVAVTALVNLRHVMMGAAFGRAIERRSGRRVYPALFFLADEIWALAMRRAVTGPLSLAYFMGLALPLYASYVAATLAGALGAGLIVEPRRYGLDFAVTAVFLVLLAGLWRGRASIAPVASSALVALAAEHLFPGPWYLFLGGASGVLAGAVMTRGDGA